MPPLFAIMPPLLLKGHGQNAEGTRTKPSRYRDNCQKGRMKSYLLFVCAARGERGVFESYGVRRGLGNVRRRNIAGCEVLFCAVLAKRRPILISAGGFPVPRASHYCLRCRLPRQFKPSTFTPGPKLYALSELEPRMLVPSMTARPVNGTRKSKKVCFMFSQSLLRTVRLCTGPHSPQ